MVVFIFLICSYTRRKSKRVTEAKLNQKANVAGVSGADVSQSIDSASGEPHKALKIKQIKRCHEGINERQFYQLSQSIGF